MIILSISIIIENNKEIIRWFLKLSLLPKP